MHSIFFRDSAASRKETLGSVAIMTERSRI